MYLPRRPSQTQFVPLRGLSYHVRTWGTPQAGQPPLLMVHGWMDVSASYQFVVDALAQDRWVVAPDWRGFGLTSDARDNFWFPDYLADLDALIDHLQTTHGLGDTPIDLVGHSMGGNVVMAYAGVRPQRIRRLVNLEGFGMPATKPAQAPGRYSQWLDELKAVRQGEKALQTYDSLAGVARRLVKTNHRLREDQALWLAQHWARPNADGRWAILGEPGHKVVNAQLYRLDEMQAVFQRITAPVLAVEAADDSLGQWWKGRYTLTEYHERLQVVPDCRVAVVPDAGHMLHHDQPAEVARLIETFLA